MVALVVRGLEFAYPGGAPVLCGVDLDVRAGEVVCLIGPNGAGKSTLLRLCAGLIEPTAGTVSFAGQPLRDLPLRARAQRIGVVPQALRALPAMRVRDFIAQGRYAHRARFARSTPADHAAIERALDEADIRAFAERPLEELSGGQRQRALVARALAQEPELVLVDEPTNALDPRHQLQVFGLVAGLGCRGRAALAITHDLNLASQFATRIALLDAGRIVADGSVHEVLRADVLEPVYRTRFETGAAPVAGWGEPRPWVLPWDAPARPDVTRP
ncbi:MAG: ABC transporter ATP-binding protein [Planctomycetota bacterium]